MISKALLVVSVNAMATSGVSTVDGQACWKPSGCDHGDFKSSRDSGYRICTCDGDDWGGNCCDEFVGKCRRDMEDLCPVSELQPLDFPISNMLNQNGTYNGPITLGTADDGLPTNLQGVFWLQDQWYLSSIMSFGPSRDGEGISKWRDDGTPFRIRVGGDRTWSSASRSLNWMGVSVLDLVNEFRGNSAKDPTEFDIVIIPMALSFLPNFLMSVFNSLISFKMSFIPLEDKRHEYPADNGRPAAVQWARPSKILGFNIGLAYYEVAQIIDGEGRPTAAYDSWIEYNKADGLLGSYWKDGNIYYHSV